MIEEPENPTPEEETPVEETPAEETPAEAPEEAAAEEAAAPEEAAPEAEAEAPAETEAAEPEAADDAPAPSSQPPAEEAEPVEQLSPKEKRRQTRSRAGEARPQRSVEERIQDRAAERARKAGSRKTRRVREREKRRAGAAERQTPQPVAAVEEAEKTGHQRVRQGIVVSDKADKTITVKIEVARRHRVYKKIVRTSSTLHAHDERNEAHAGDTVRIIEARPLSRTKRWRLVEIVERAR